MNDDPQLSTLYRLFLRAFYEDAYSYLRRYRGRWTKRAALEFRTFPQGIRRAAA